MSFKDFENANLFSVKGKVAIVTGGGTGIGKGMAVALALNGARVIITGRRFEVIEATALEINAACSANGQGGEVIAIQGDVATKAGVEKLYDAVSKVVDKVDLLVNNAGFSSNWKVDGDLDDPAQAPAKLWSIEEYILISIIDFANMTAVHVSGPYFMGVKFIPLFQKSTDPVIVNITSLGAFFLNKEVLEYSYAQSKAAEQHLTRLMAVALGPFKIRVNAVVPGLFPTQLTTGLKDDSGEFWPPQQKAIKTEIPLRRAGTWAEIAGPVMMMTTPAGAYLNGASLTVDGGWSMYA